MLDFRIETFLSVCKNMSYTKAANELHITQPAVSQHIHYLQKEYGVKLFEYKDKKLSLTEAGSVLLNSVSVVKNDNEYLKKKLIQKYGDRKSITIGVTQTVGEFIIADLIADYLKLHKNTEIKIVTSNTEKLLKMLKGGEINFALIEGYFPKNDYEYKVFSLEKFIAVSNKKEKASHLKDLFDKTLIIRENGSGSRDVLEKNLDAIGYSINNFENKIECNCINAIKELAVKGCGINFLYKVAVERELKEKTLFEIPLNDFNISHDFTFIWNKGSSFSSEYIKTIEELKKS